MPSASRVALLVLDGFGPEFATPDFAPCLSRLAAAGGLAPVGGLAELVASTGPNLATLVTGVSLAEHGVLANRVFDAGGLPTGDVSVEVPTILQRARAGGRSTALAVSDSDIVNTVRGSTADACWPDVATRDGYEPDVTTVEHTIGALAAGFDLVVAHLQGVDTATHAHGVDTEAAVDAYRAVDRHVGTIADALGPDWQRTLLLVVSDHRAENLTRSDPVQLGQALDGIALVIDDGSAALVRPTASLEETLARSLRCDGVAGITPIGRDCLVAWTEPGRAFGRDQAVALRAIHGNMTTRACLTLVSGGHSAVSRLASSIRRTPPPLRMWARVIAEVLGV